MKRALVLLWLAACAQRGAVAPHPAAHPATSAAPPVAEKPAPATTPPPVPPSDPAEMSLDDVDPSLLGDGGEDAAIDPVLAKAVASLGAHQWDRAIAQARAALAIDADDPRAIAALARGFIGKGEWDSAHEALVQGTGTAGSRPAGAAELWHLMGRCSYHLGDSSRALDELGRAVKLKKDDAAAWNLLGVVHLERGEAAEAVQALETARAHDAGSIAILTNLGSAYRRAAAAASVADEAAQLLHKAERSYQSARDAGLGAGGGYAAASLGLGLLYLDAAPFPGLDEAQRLEKAVASLAEVDSMEDPAIDRPAVERDLADARRELSEARQKEQKAAR